MPARQRIVDYLVAATVVVAFGGLFFGRLMLYPVATAPGSFLERLAARSDAWDVGHRWMLLGMICLIPAAIGLRRAFRAHSPRLADVATGLTILGIVGPQLFGAMGVRAGLGLAFAGFSAVAWNIAAGAVEPGPTLG